MGSKWATAPPAHALLSPTMTRASYDNISAPGVTQGVLDEELSMLEQTGARAITIDMGYDPWLSGDRATIAEDDALVARIRATGRLLVLKDASAERYRHGKLPWAQFADAWVKRVRSLAARYHPDYYTVIKEPPWYAPMIAGLSRTDLSSPTDRQVLDPATWTALLARLVAAVRSVSPDTKVGISADGNLFHHSPGDELDLALLRAAVHMPGIDFLGFDLYTARAFADTRRFLETTGAGGKDVWINEAWSTDGPTARRYAQEQLDAAWARVLVEFANVIHAVGVSPFFTDYFASYEVPPQSARGLLSFYKGRTPVFRAFRRYGTSPSWGQRGPGASPG